MAEIHAFLAAALRPTSIQLLGDSQSAAASNDVVLSQFLLVREEHPGGLTCLEAMCGARAALSLFTGGRASELPLYWICLLRLA